MKKLTDKQLREKVELLTALVVMQHYSFPTYPYTIIPQFEWAGIKERIATLQSKILDNCKPTKN